MLEIGDPQKEKLRARNKKVIVKELLRRIRTCERKRELKSSYRYCRRALELLQRTEGIHSGCGTDRLAPTCGILMQRACLHVNVGVQSGI
jgi:hypothetical protein